MIEQTEEQIVARLLAGRLDKPPAPKPPPKPEVKAQERWADKPDEAIMQDAAKSAEAQLKMAQRWRDRRQEQQAKELAEFNDPRARYQRELDHWWQLQRDLGEALDDHVMIGGFREPRYKTTCHRGPGDPDYGL